MEVTNLVVVIVLVANLMVVAVVDVTRVVVVED